MARIDVPRLSLYNIDVSIRILNVDAHNGGTLAVMLGTFGCTMLAT